MTVALGSFEYGDGEGGPTDPDTCGRNTATITKRYSIRELQDLRLSEDAEFIFAHAKGVHDDFRMDDLYHQHWRARVLAHAATFDSKTYLAWCIDAYLHLDRIVAGVDHSEVCFEMLLMAHWAQLASFGNGPSQDELLQELLEADYLAYVFQAGTIALDDEGQFISQKVLSDTMKQMEHIKNKADSEYKEYLDCKMEHEKDGDPRLTSEE